MFTPKDLKTFAQSQPNWVYHASPQQGLSELVTQDRGTHGQFWLYAATDWRLGSVFLAKPHCSDFICARRRINGKVTLIERFKGAFDLCFAGKQGAIYILASTPFSSGLTDFAEEVVSSDPVKPLHEVRLTDLKQFMLDLADQGDLVIHYFPQRPADIPTDDEDLIVDAVVWARQYGEAALDKLAQYHPQLKHRAITAVQDSRYDHIQCVNLISAFDPSLR